MKVITVLAVDNFNLKTFEVLPGFDAFSKKYEAWKREMSCYFYFTEEEAKIKEEAKKELDASALIFGEYYRIELGSDEEIKHYPIVFISFYTGKHPVVLEKNGETYIDSKAGKKNFQSDIHNGKKLVLTKKARDFFEANIPDIQFKEVFNESGKQGHYILEGLKILQHPRIYPDYTSIEPYEDDTFHIRNSDNRFDYPDGAFAELKECLFMVDNTFTYKGKTYTSPYKIYVCSGSIAYELKKHFNLEREGITLSFPTLKYC